MQEFLKKCAPLNEQPWGVLPLWEQFAHGKPHERYVRSAQLHDSDGEPLVLDFSTPETADLLQDARRVVSQVGCHLAEFPASGTVEARQPISWQKANAMVRRVGISLEEIRTECAKPRTLERRP